jgi:hypothetical protein
MKVSNSKPAVPAIQTDQASPASCTPMGPPYNPVKPQQRDGFMPAVKKPYVLPQVGETFVKDGVKITVIGSQPKPGAAPTVFLNADETLSPGELASSWTDIGSAAGVRPDSTEFKVAAAHSSIIKADKKEKPVELGFSLTNSGCQPMTVTISVENVDFIRGGKTVKPASIAPPAPWIPVPNTKPQKYTATIGANSTVVFPAVRMQGSATGNRLVPDDTATYTASVSITSGQKGDLVVRDVARDPASTTQRPTGSTTDVRHHEGVFTPQMPIGKPTLLRPGTGVRLTMPNDGLTPPNFAYCTTTSFQVGIPAGSMLTLKGVGGKAIMTFPPNNKVEVFSPSETMSVEKAVERGILVPVKDANGKPVTQGTPAVPVYQINAQWQPGSNAGLDIVIAPEKPKK